MSSGDLTMRSLKSHQRAKARGKPARSRTTVDIVGQGGLMITGQVGQLFIRLPRFQLTPLILPPDLCNPRGRLGTDFDPEDEGSFMGRERYLQDIARPSSIQSRTGYIMRTNQPPEITCCPIIYREFASLDQSRLGVLRMH